MEDLDSKTISLKTMISAAVTVLTTPTPLLTQCVSVKLPPNKARLMSWPSDQVHYCSKWSLDKPGTFRPLIQACLSRSIFHCVETKRTVRINAPHSSGTVCQAAAAACATAVLW